MYPDRRLRITSRTASALSSRHEIDEEIIEYGRIFLQGIGQCGASFYILFDGVDHPGKHFVLFLFCKEIKALDQGKACIDHRREDPGKDDHILLRNLFP